MAQRPSSLNRAIFPLIALVPLVAATLWLVTGEPGTATAGKTAMTAVTAPAQPPQTPAAVAQPAEPAPVPETATVLHQTPRSLGADPFASSLAGTDIDGNLTAGADGQLIVDLATKDFFDYFLNTVGEVSPETALAKISTLARDHLPTPAADQALAILDQYLDYKQQALAMGNRSLDPARQRDPAYQLQVLQTALADLKQLRRHTFDPATHDAFFGLEEAYGEYTLASIAIQQRDDLSAQSKQVLMEWQREQLPAQIRGTETRMMEETELNRQRQTALAEASSPEDAGERLRSLGVEPRRVEEVVGYLQERQQFDQQFQQYRQALASLETAAISDDDFEFQQNQLLDRHFASEQARTWAKLRSLEP